MRFSELPNELQLAVTQSCDPFTIEELRFASKRLMSLARKLPRNLKSMQLLSFEAAVSEQKQSEEEDLLVEINQKKSRDYLNEPVRLKEVYLDGSWKEDVHYIWNETREKNDTCLYYKLFNEMTAVRKINFRGLYVHNVFHTILWFGKMFLPKLRHLDELTLFHCDLRDISTLMSVLKHLNQLKILEIYQCNVSRRKLNCMDCITNEIILSVRKKFILDIKNENKNSDDYIENFSPNSMQDLEEIYTAEVNSKKAAELIRRVNTCKNINDSLLEGLKKNPIGTIELRNINCLITVGAIVIFVKDVLKSDYKAYWNFGNIEKDGFETLPCLLNNEDLHCRQKSIVRFKGTSILEKIQQFEIKTFDGKKTFIFATDL